jgi:hypothetical protein
MSAKFTVSALMIIRVAICELLLTSRQADRQTDRDRQGDRQRQIDSHNEG